MPWPAIATWKLISAGIGLWGASAERRARERAIEEQMRLLENQREWRNVIQSVRQTPSAALKASYRRSLADIQRAEQTGGRVIEGELGAKGASPGRAAGARWGMRLRAAGARGRAATEYASAEQERKDRLLGLLGSISGDASTNLARLAGAKGEAKTDFLGSIGDIVGHAAGEAKGQSILDQIFGTEEKGGTAGDKGGQDTETDLNAILREAGVVPKADTSVPEERTAPELAAFDLAESLKPKRRTTRENLGYRKVPNYLSALENEEEFPYPSWGRRRRRRLTV